MRKVYLLSASIALFVFSILLQPLTSNVVYAAPATQPTSANAGSGNVNTDPDPCDANIKNPLTWIVCPIVGIMHEGTNFMQSIINRLMEVDTTAIFDTSTDSGKAYYNAWNSFRLFGLALIVIAGLVMVISQALGLEIIDAYTIKKIMPRLVVAIIGISLSWWLLRYAAELTNDLGIGVRSVIYAPFQDLAKNYGGMQHFGSNLFELIFGGAFLAVLGVGGILSLLATIGLAALIAFLVLVVRQIVLTFLFILAPIAIACYVLPNTQKVYKIWWESLSKGLLMFPIITAFIAAGQVFSIVASSNQGSSFGINNIVAIVAYFLPYFALPFTFRLAGGAISTIGGVVNDRNRGTFDRLKKYRDNKSAENIAALRSGDRFKGRAFGTRGVSSGLNSLTRRATTKNFGVGEAGKAALTQKDTLSGAAYAQTGKAKATQFNDPILQAQTYSSAAEAKARLGQDFGLSEDDTRKAIAGANAAGGFGASKQVWAAKQLAATGTGYDDESQFFSTIARVSRGNNDQAHDMWGEMRGLSERAGRNDLKAAYGLGTGALDKIIANSSTTNYDPSRVRDQMVDTFASMGTDAARGVDNATLARNKPKSMGNIMRNMERDLANQRSIADDPNISPEEQQRAAAYVGQITAKIENIKASTMYGPEVTNEAFYGSRKNTGDRSTGYTTMTEAQRSPTVDVRENQENIHQSYSDQSHTEEQQRGIFDPNDPRRQQPPDDPEI